MAYQNGTVDLWDDGDESQLGEGSCNQADVLGSGCMMIDVRGGSSEILSLVVPATIFPSDRTSPTSLACLNSRSGFDTPRDCLTAVVVRFVSKTSRPGTVPD